MLFSSKSSFLLQKPICLIIIASFFSITTSEAVLIGGKPSTITLPADSFAGAINPAGNVFVEDRVDLGVRWFHDNKHTEFFNNSVPGVNGHFDADAQKNNWYFPEGAINKSFKTEIGCQSWNWALSLTAYNLVFNRGSYALPIPIAGTTPPSYELREQVVSPVLGVQINEQHSVGISVDFHLFRPNIKGLEFFDTPGLTVAPGFVTNKGFNVAWAVTCTLGWRYQITKALCFGVIYRPSTNFSKLQKYKGFYPELGLNNTLQEVGVGFSYALTPQFIAAFDFNWLNFADTTSGNQLLDANGHINVLGSPNGSGPGFRDQYIFTIASAYKVTEKFNVKAAYVYLTPKTRSTQTMYNSLIDQIVQSVACVGFTYQFLEGKEISMIYCHGFNAQVNGPHSIPAIIGGGGVNLRESNDTIGLSLGYKY